MAVATSNETVEPLPGSEPGHAALPVCDAAMSDRTFSRRTPEQSYVAGWRPPIQAVLTMA